MTEDSPHVRWLLSPEYRSRPYSRAHTRLSFSRDCHRGEVAWLRLTIPERAQALAPYGRLPARKEDRERFRALNIERSGIRQRYQLPSNYPLGPEQEHNP